MHNSSKMSAYRRDVDGSWDRQTDRHTDRQSSR